MHPPPAPPDGFTNRDLRAVVAQLLTRAPEAISPGQMTYDLRRLRHHGLIERLPGSHRYRVTDIGLADALFLTRTHDRILRTGLAQITDPTSPSRLRTADRATAPPSTTSSTDQGSQHDPPPTT